MVLPLDKPIQSEEVVKIGKAKVKWHTIRGLQLGIARYDFASQFVRGKTVLDVACGDGIGTAYLLSKGAKTICSGDISTDSIRHAKKLAGASCSFVVLDACALPFKEETFDTIVSIETIEHLNDQEKFLHECRRTLKEEGWLICSTVNRDSFSQNQRKPWFPGHAKELSIDEFSRLLGKYFDQVTIYGLPWSKKFGKLGQFIYRHKTLLESLLLSFQPARSLIQFLTRWLFPHYHLIRLDQVDPLNLGHFLTSKYKPFLLEDDGVNLMGIIAVVKK